MYKLHLFQINILRQLGLNPTMKFSDIKISELESEHINYHLQKLVELGYVKKTDEGYSLTNTGKDYVGMLEDEVEIIEKQPKVSVLLSVRREDKNGKIHHLLSKRLKQPYFGKVGRLTGKLKFGEGVIEGARRELFEETGLKSEDIKVNEVYQKIRKDEQGTVQQDSIFFIVNINNPTGKLVERTPVQENFWITKEELEERADLDHFDDLKLHDTDDTSKPWYSESIGISKGY